MISAAPQYAKGEHRQFRPAGGYPYSTSLPARATLGSLSRTTVSWAVARSILNLLLRASAEQAVEVCRRGYGTTGGASCQVAADRRCLLLKLIGFSALERAVRRTPRCRPFFGLAGRPTLINFNRRQPGSFDLRQCRCSNEWESDADRWIPAYAGMTNRAAGMTNRAAGMTNRVVGMRCTVVGMTNRVVGMRCTVVGMTASGLTIWRQPAP